MMTTLTKLLSLYKNNLLQGMKLMNKLIFSLLLLVAFALSGCNNSTLKSETHAKTSISHPVKKVPETKENTYQSITEYHDLITGENLKTGILQITRDNNILTFKMDYKLSDKLKNIMLNTKNKFYLTFKEVDGQHKLDSFFLENPELVEGNLNVVHADPNLHITQIMKLKENATPEEIKTAMTPANYELVFLNENYQKVAVVIGLDLNSINP